MSVKSKNLMSVWNTDHSKILLPLCLSVVVLNGCSQGIGLVDRTTTASVLRTTHASAYEHTLAEKISPQEAFVKLPMQAGRVLGLVQRRYVNGVLQTITYHGDHATRGENKVDVRLTLNDSAWRRKGNTLKVSSVSIRQIRRDMAAVLPGVSMRIANSLHSNSYGPFGYALGRAAGQVRCLYGWQNVKGEGKHDRWALLTSASQKPALSLRVRICRAGVSETQLVNVMRHLRIEADPGKVLQPSAVSWSSGKRTAIAESFSNYQPEGYQSQQNAVIPERAYPTEKPYPAEKVRKRSVKKVQETKKSNFKARTKIKSERAAKFIAPQLPVPDNFNQKAPLVEAVNTRLKRASSHVPLPVVVEEGHLSPSEQGLRQSNVSVLQNKQSSVLTAKKSHSQAGQERSFIPLPK